MALLGLGLLAGAGGTLALSYEKVAPEDIFTIKVILRVGFLAVGPAAAALFCCVEPPEADNMRPLWAALAVCAITVIPFGLSLLKLFLWHQRGKKK